MPASITRRGLLAQAGAAALAAAGPKVTITSVKAAPVRMLPPVRPARPFSSDFDPERRRAFGPFSQLGGAILVQVRTSAGVTGYGLGGGGGAGAYIIEHHLAGLLAGVDPRNVELLWDQMYSSTSFYGRRGLAVMAISGIDLALWDILGKLAGQPVYRFLGGAVRDRVPGYYTLGNLEHGLKLGFRAFKFPVAEGPPQGAEGMERTVRRLAEARRAAGDDALIMIDCLARWDVPYTLEMARRLADVRLHFIEEPLYPDDLDGYARLCREVTSTRIASGEHEFTHHGFRELVRHRAAHVLQPDLTWGGGLTAGRKIAALAAEAGLPLLPHRGGSLFAIHLALASPHCPMAESFGTGDSGNELMELMTPRLERAHYLAPEAPGLGFELSAAVLKRHAPALL